MLGLDLTDRLGLGTVGLLVHSRSALLIGPLQDLLGKGTLVSVLGYGAFYNSVDLEDFDPPARDLPSLYVNGDQDGDVGAAANWWITEHIQEKRTTPLLSAQAPGFGHMFINRALQDAEHDDRHGCEIEDCLSATDHEQLLTTVALDWFDATMREADTTLPLAPDAPLPGTIGEVPVRWLAATHGIQVEHLPISAFRPLAGKQASSCVHVNPMIPSDREDLCPEPDSGVITTVSQLLNLTGARAKTKVTGARMLALHLLLGG